ncbi:MAG: hypothetical protein JNN01_12210 [Opitutaceae bacterium]|nr:hypothetical protein [Opitutaceae bacterium]
MQSLENLPRRARSWWKTLALGIALGVILRSQAQVILIDASLETSSLINHALGPFSIDLQFIDGEGIGNANNSVQISNFNFSGGGWIGSQPGTINLTDSSFLQEFIGEFSPGTSLSFKISLTDNANPTGVPDRLSFAILDHDLIEVPTLDASGALVAIDITGSGLLKYSWSTDPQRTDISIAAPSLAQVPEPAASAVVLAALLCAGRISWKIIGALQGTRR